MVNVSAAEMLSINIELCVAFTEIGKWEFVGPRVSDVLELAEMSRGRFHVPKKVRE